MTDNFPVDLNLSQLLVAILDTVGSVEIPTVKFVNASGDNNISSSFSDYKNGK